MGLPFRFEVNGEFTLAMPNSEPRYRLVIFDAVDDPQTLGR